MSDIEEFEAIMAKIEQARTDVKEALRRLRADGKCCYTTMQFCHTVMPRKMTRWQAAFLVGLIEDASREEEK